MQGWPLSVLVLSSRYKLIMSNPYVPKSSVGIVGHSHVVNMLLAMSLEHGLELQLLIILACGNAKTTVAAGQNSR